MSLDVLVAALREEEGVRYAAYQDSRGIWTIGVGFNIDGNRGGGLDDTEIDFILHHRLAKCEQIAEAYPWYAGISEPRQHVVLDMIFNMGGSTFAQFHGTIHSIAIGDFEAAAQGMLQSRWATQVGKRAEKLARIMRTGVWE